MNGELADSNNPDDLGDLRAQALLNDIERRMSAQNVRLLVTRWLSLPLMLVILVAMVVGLVLGFGFPGPLLGGIVAVAGAAAGFAAWARQQDEDIADLERERDSLLRDHPVLQQDHPPRIGERHQNPSVGTS